MRVGFGQFEPIIGDYGRNSEAIRSICADCARHDLLVFPELAVTGYDFPDKSAVEACAEPFETGPTSNLVRELSAEHSMTIVMGYAERDSDVLYNSAILCTPDGTLTNYRKLHLFSRETLFFTPGDAPPPVVDTPVGRVGIMICFDWIFPETARLLALDGAQIIAHPSNLVLDLCQQSMFCRSVENRVFTITANRIGTETSGGRTLHFTGASQVVSPRGEYLLTAPKAEDSSGGVEIDPTDADDKTITEFNSLWDDRRTTMYEGLL